MKAGDLISFKPIDFGLEDWSNPSIGVGEYPAPDCGLWYIWCDGVYCVIDDQNYEIAYLTKEKEGDIL